MPTESSVQNMGYPHPLCAREGRPKMSRFWGVEDKDYFASRSLDVFIKKIRTALEDEPGVELKTIRGVGFKLIAE